MEDGRTSGSTRCWRRPTPSARRSELDAEHPLYVLYTSGSTAKPKGILHTTGGYMTRVAVDAPVRLRPQAGARTCTGARPTSAGSPGTPTSSTGRWPTARRSVMYEGAPDYPHKGIWWELCERYGVTLFYTAPTAIRACMKWGAEHVEQVRPVQAAAARHGRRADQPQGMAVVPQGRSAASAARSSTRGGRPRPAAIMITTLPGAADDEARRRGHAAARGSTAAVVDEEGKRSRTAPRACSSLRRPWPAMLRTLYKEDDRFVETYFGEVRARRPTSSATRPGRTTTATSGSSAASTTSSTSRATGCPPPRSSRRSSPTRRSPRRP